MSDNGLNISRTSCTGDDPRYCLYRPDWGNDVFTLMRQDRGFSYVDALETDAEEAEGAAEQGDGREQSDGHERSDGRERSGTDASAPQPVHSLFWPGCTLSSYSQELTDATYHFLRKRGLADGLSIRCCGNIIRYAGGRAACTDYRDNLVSTLEKRGIQRIITVCPNCFYGFGEMLQSRSGIEVCTLSRLLADEGLRISQAQMTPARSVCIHDSCPDRRCGIDATAVRRLFEGIELREMQHNRHNARCCGLGKLLFIGDPQTSRRLRESRIEEFVQTGAEQLVTSCFSCANAFQDPQSNLSAVHYLELLFGVRVDWTAVYESARRIEQQSQKTSQDARPPHNAQAPRKP
jgi:hypothetical protein